MTKTTTLSEQYPQLANEWHPTKNGNLTLDQLTAGSHKKIWWRCDHGHEWETLLKVRTKGQGCPYCSNRKILKGYNDLATTHPEVAKEWHPTKNQEMTPEQIGAGSSKKVWWHCEHGHEWETTPQMRTKQETGCPYCSGRKVWVGYNDLATTDPDLAKYWHNELNHPLTPKMVSRGSGKKVWWRCREGHEWKREIYLQTSDKYPQWFGCPICSDNPTRGEKIHPKTKRKTLLETFPDLAKELHPTKNESIHLPSIGSTSKQKVWWLGKCGHEWETSVSIRTKGRAGCPYCTNQKLLEGFNDLTTTYPLLAKEWHPTKNGTLKPEEIVGSYTTHVWWLGECGHEWKSQIKARMEGSNCPYCSNLKVLSGFNDLETLYPNLMKEWHPTNNEGLNPNTLSPGSTQRAWWKCQHGHEWETVVLLRTRKQTGCPICYKEKRAIK